MKKVLIVGGCGFIGTAITEELLNRNYSVGVYDIRACSAEDSEQVKHYCGEVLSDKSLQDIISQYDTLIYLLSSIMPQQSMDNPEEVYSVEIPSLLRVLELCRNFGVKRVIFSSSGGSVYGEHDFPNSEDTTMTNPQNHYAICKLTCEKILMLYNHLYGMDNVVMRISNPYGIHQRIASGVGAISSFAVKIMKDEPIQVFGDGKIVRDYLPVECVANAFAKAVEWVSIPSVSPIFNVGSGEGLSLNEVINIISDELGKKPIVDYAAPRDFDIATSVLDTSKTESYLGKITEKSAEEYIRFFCRTLRK